MVLVVRVGEGLGDWGRTRKGVSLTLSLESSWIGKQKLCSCGWDMGGGVGNSLCSGDGKMDGWFGCSEVLKEQAGQDKGVGWRCC
jgi:hypothetical protein